ncbi:MAG TPA: ScyD/ScyE family protein [Actinomycetes bacterium]|nr:ScyD/ScyE family protein [Actinomycetes bacterium]
MKLRATASAMFVIPALTGVVLVSTVAPAAAKAAPDVLLENLSSPKGLAVGQDGNPIVAQGAFGPPGPVLSYTLHGRGHGSTFDITEPTGLVDVAEGPFGEGWGLGGGILYRQAADATSPVEVLNLRAYQKSDPDPYNTNGRPGESNAYGLTVLPNGDALVADAAANDIVRVTPDGDAWTVARFDARVVSTDQAPPNLGLPPAMPAEAVPTSVTNGPGGDVLVGQLVGFPFPVGDSNVWRIDPDANGVLCSVDNPEQGCSVYASGFTAIQDVAYDGRNRTLYVYQLAADGVFAFEEGLGTGVFPDAVLTQQKAGKRTELAAGQLSQPGGVAVGRAAGQVLVTDGVFTSGRLLLVKN